MEYEHHMVTDDDRKDSNPRYDQEETQAAYKANLKPRIPLSERPEWQKLKAETAQAKLISDKENADSLRFAKTLSADGRAAYMKLSPTEKKAFRDRNARK